MVRNLILSAYVSACGPVMTMPATDPLVELVDEYRVDAQQAGLDVDMRHLMYMDFADPGFGNVGVCETIIVNDYHFGIVKILPYMSEISTRWTVYHELSHCIFLMGHIDTEFSIMNSAIAYDEEIEPQWDSLTASLFYAIQEMQDP